MWRTLTLSGKHIYYLSDRFLLYINIRKHFLNLWNFFLSFWLCWIFVAAQTFSRCDEQGLLSSCGEQASHCGGLFYCRALVLDCGLSSCVPGTQQLHGIWDLPRPGIEPLSPVLQGRLLATGPPGKP